MGEPPPEYELLDEGVAAAVWVRRERRLERRFLPTGPFGPMQLTVESTRLVGKRERYSLTSGGWLEAVTEETEDAERDGWRPVRRARLAPSRAPARIRALLDLTG